METRVLRWQLKRVRQPPLRTERVFSSGSGNEAKWNGVMYEWGVWLVGSIVRRTTNFYSNMAEKLVVWFAQKVLSTTHTPRRPHQAKHTSHAAAILLRIDSNVYRRNGKSTLNWTLQWHFVIFCSLTAWKWSPCERRSTCMASSMYMRR